MMGKKIKILVVTKNDDDRKIIHSEISNQDDLQLIGIENDEVSTIIKSERLKPDVLIMDLQPPGIEAAELAPVIHRRSPSTSIIMMCDRDENDYAGIAFKAGISGYLLREADMNKLIHAVKIVNLGGYYISASITSRVFDIAALARQLPGQFIEFKKSIPSFSSKERCIIADIAQGFTDDEIGKHLNYSTGTIRNSIASIKRKTNLESRMQIAIYSLVFGLIRLDELDIINSNRHIQNDGIQ